MEIKGKAESFMNSHWQFFNEEDTHEYGSLIRKLEDSPPEVIRRLYIRYLYYTYIL